MIYLTIIRLQTPYFLKEEILCRHNFEIITMLARQMLSNICAKLITYLKDIIFSEDFCRLYRQNEHDFTRNRKLTFTTIILLLINFLKNSLQDELDYFFKAVHQQEVPERTVTKSAFCRARRKVKPEAFVHLNRKLADFFYQNCSYRTWRGFRLLGIDGSTVKLPSNPGLAAEWGGLARTSHLYDPLNRLTLDARLAPETVGERTLALSHLGLLGPGDLLLLDRGYPAFWLFACLMTRGIHFCARMALNHWRVVQQFYLSGRPEQIIVLEPFPCSLPRCRELGVPVAPLTLRLLRIELENGETEILCTSLVDQETFPQDAFAELYHQRWFVEEDLKLMKNRLSVENWSGKSLQAVQQDFHAKIFAKNLTLALAHHFEPRGQETPTHKKYPYKINVAQALSKMKDTIVLLFLKADVRTLLEKIVNLLLRTLEPFRPNRKYPRKLRPNPKVFAFAYKPAR